MNFTCPVPWEWTEDKSEADVVWFDVLSGYPTTKEAVEKERTYPGQFIAFYSLESGKYYDIVYRAKEIGIDFTVDYRIWPGTPTGR